MSSENCIGYLPETSVASMLPFGAMLRPLLNDSCLNDTDLNNILKARGVFVGDSDKKSTVPLMVTMVLSPREFVQLQERQATKEDNPKHRNSSIKSKSSKSLTSIINGFSIDVVEFQKNNYGININSSMDFGFVSDNQIQLEYSIIRDNLTKDWVRPQSAHTAKIIITKNTATNEIGICNEYTSKETDEINKKVIKDIILFLKNQGEVEDELKTLRASDFTNRERFNFMLRLAQDSEDRLLEFLEIKDVELGPDPENPPKNPNSVIQQNVKKIIINGNGLESNSILTDDNNKDSLLLRSIEAKYKFNCNGIQGHCVLQYGFMHFFRNQNTSQEFQVALLYLNSKTGNKTSLNNFVLNKFDSLKRKQYESIK